MENIEIKEYNDMYLKEVTELLSRDENYLPKIENSQNILLLFINNKLSGIGSTWLNSVHPYRNYISIYIDPLERNKELGFFLFKELKERYQLKNLQTFINSDDRNAVRFAFKCGFDLARQSYSYEVNKKQLKSVQSEVLKTVSSLGHLTTNQINEAINLHFQDYKRNHQLINPLNKAITIEKWRKIIGNDLSLEDSYVFIENNQIIAYLFCYKVNETMIGVSYTGNRLNTTDEYQDFLHHVVVQLFEKYKKIELEIDDCDESANLLADLFTYKTNLSWDTYTKNII